jgi:hypothetical protein
MPVDIRELDDPHVLLVRFAGAVGGDDLAGLVAVIDNPGPLELVLDSIVYFERDADLSELPLTVMAAFRRDLVATWDRNQLDTPCRSALVCPSPAHAPVVALWKEFAAAGERYRLTHRAFTSLRAATRWLGLPADAADRVCAALGVARRPGRARADATQART